MRDLTVQEAVLEVLAELGKATNHQLERLVPKIKNCIASSVTREARKLDLNVKPTFDDKGVMTRTWEYSLV